MQANFRRHTDEFQTVSRVNRCKQEVRSWRVACFTRNMQTEQALDYLSILGLLWSASVLAWYEYRHFTYHSKIRRIRERLLN